MGHIRVVCIYKYNDGTNYRMKNVMKLHSNGTVDISGNVNAEWLCCGYAKLGSYVGYVEFPRHGTSGARRFQIASNQGAWGRLSIVSSNADDDTIDTCIVHFTPTTACFNVPITSTGDITAFSSSDCRLKNNLKIISCPIDKIKAVSGYEFDWNTRDQDLYKGNDVGVIAQEVEKVLPQIVCTRDTGYKAIKYEKIVPLLIEATKEQQCTIEKQQRQIDTLTCQVELLLKRCA